MELILSLIGNDKILQRVSQSCWIFCFRKSILPHWGIIAIVYVCKRRCSCFIWYQPLKDLNKVVHSFNSLRKQPTFGDATAGFPAKWRLRNVHRNSILITRHYPDRVQGKSVLQPAIRASCSYLALVHRSLQLAPKPFLISRIDYNPSIIWISPQNSNGLSGKLRTKITSPIAKSTTPGLSDMTFLARCQSCQSWLVLLIAHASWEIWFNQS